MNYNQVAADGKDDNSACQSEVDKDLLKTHPPLDLCYDLAIDSAFYRVSDYIMDNIVYHVL